MLRNFCHHTVFPMTEGGPSTQRHADKHFVYWDTNEYNTTTE
jgi:hypothetical protein